MSAPSGTAVPERIVAGGRDGDFLTVRHVVLAGSDRQIGRGLAALARRVHGGSAYPRPARSPVVQRARRSWFERHYPALAERIRGVAEEYGVDPARDDIDPGMLGTYRLPAGCSAVFHPRGGSDGPLLGRNFDFPTTCYTELVGLPPLAGERPLAADPWVVELYPDRGHASLTVGIMDVLGAMDGINSAGLAVVLLADDESPRLEASGSGQVGLSEQQVVRFLLDSCATVEEAQQALLTAKHYYLFVPCHFLVADAAGRAFVWEHSPHRNLERIVEADASRGGRLVCTNHLLHRWPDPTRLPDDRRSGIAGLTYHRWRTLNAHLQERPPADPDAVRDQLAEVAFTAPAEGTRTLWSAVYDLRSRAVQVSFYRHDRDGVSHYDPAQQFSLIHS